jgi:hypothetical protein
MHRSKLALLLFVFTFFGFSRNQGFAQNQNVYPQRPPQPVQPPYGNYQSLEQQYGHSFPGRDAWSGQGAGPAVLADRARWAAAQSQSQQSEYDDYRERKLQRELLAQSREPQAHADPEAPDQSELLRNSKDPDFILRNFRTMYVDAHAAQYFGSDQMKAALGKNKEFQKLRIHIVDDPRVADVVLKVSYTFAWDYPFELRHQNTTVVLLAGKGEGPFSGPLGAADVARKFVNAAKPWREEKKSPKSP